MVSSDVRNSPIMVSGRSDINDNLTNNTPAILTINKAILTVKANNKSRLFREENPVFDSIISGFKLG